MSNILVWSLLWKTPAGNLDQAPPDAVESKPHQGSQHAMRPLDDEINVLKLKLEAMGPLDGLSEEGKLSYSAYRERLSLLEQHSKSRNSTSKEQQGRNAGALATEIRNPPSCPGGSLS